MQNLLIAIDWVLVGIGLLYCVAGALLEAFGFWSDINE